MPTILRRALPLAIAALSLAALPAAFGPPWLSVEFPANPHDTRTRAAFLVVNTYHHGTPTQFALSGSAEGIVRGERRSVPLRFTATERAGAQALTRQWPDEGRWVLHIQLQQQGATEAAALVVLGSDGTPSRVTVPTHQDGPWSVPRAITAAEVTAALADAGEQVRVARR